MGVLLSCDQANIQSDLEADEDIELNVQNEEREDNQFNSPEYVYRHRSSLKGGNDREKYIWDVLRLSLEATYSDFGAYEIQEVEGINQVREDEELIHNTGLITVISDSINEENLSKLDHIQVPLLRNLLGHRVFFITEDRKQDLEDVISKDDLKQFTFGIALGWNDKIILENAGIEIYEADRYEALYRGLTEGVYDVFSRSVLEVSGEYEVYSETYSNLYIDENVLLRYPLPRYFWFSRSDHGEKLMTRVEVGLNRIIENGELYDLFNSYFADDIEKLNLDERIIIDLENPMYIESFDEIDSKYRYNPLRVSDFQYSCN